MIRAVLSLALVVLVGCAAPPRPATRVLRVGTSGDYPPFSVASQGQLAGFDIVVAQRFAQDSGQQLEIVPFQWPDLERDLAANRFDVAMGGVTMRPGRALVGTFARPVARAGAMVLADPDVLVTAAALDEPERRIAVNAGGHLERVARRLFPRAALIPTPSNLVLPDLLASKRADAIVTDELEAPLFRRRLAAVIVFGPLTRDCKAYLARDPGLADELDQWVRAREVDGWLSSIRGRAFGPEWALPRSGEASDLDALLALVDLRLAFMPSVAVAKAARGAPTLDAAREAAVQQRAAERARLLGGFPPPIERLMTALLRASRTIQERVRSTPEPDRVGIDAMDLETEARPTLERLTDQIVALAVTITKATDQGARPSAGNIAETLDASVTPREARVAIAEAIAALYLRE